MKKIALWFLSVSVLALGAGAALTLSSTTPEITADAYTPIFPTGG